RHVRLFCWLDLCGVGRARRGSTCLMSTRLTVYILLIALAAALSGVALYSVSPDISGASIRAVVLLSALAVVAETLSLLLPNSARGSIAFIPYLATAVISPNWASLVAIVSVKLLVDTAQRVSVRTLAFNVAQHVL